MTAAVVVRRRPPRRPVEHAGTKDAAASSGASAPASVPPGRAASVAAPARAVVPASVAIAAPAVAPLDVVAAPATAPVEAPRSQPGRRHTAPAEPVRRAAPAPVRRRAVSAPVRGRAAPARRVRTRHRAGFVMLFCVVLGSAVLGLVSLNAMRAKASFRIDDVSSRIDVLEQEHLQLLLEQAQLSAPGRIADWARRNGMRLPDDIRLLHAPDASTAPAEGADASGGGG